MHAEIKICNEGAADEEREGVIGKQCTSVSVNI